jgi:hypothetical protein
MKLEEIKADRNDLIAIEEAAVRSMFSQKVTVPSCDRHSLTLCVWFSFSLSLHRSISAKEVTHSPLARETRS